MLAHTYNSQPCWSQSWDPHHPHPLYESSMSKAPSPTIGTHQHHTNVTRIRYSNPRPMHQDLWYTITQSPTCAHITTTALYLQSSTKQQKLFTKYHYQSRLSLHCPSEQHNQRQRTSTRSLSKEPLHSAISIFSSSDINELVNELLLLWPTVTSPNGQNFGRGCEQSWSWTVP